MLQRAFWNAHTQMRARGHHPAAQTCPTHRCVYACNKPHARPDWRRRARANDANAYGPRTRRAFAPPAGRD
eukprot:2452158-Lingulodinium_polyedra.AAC.1